MRIISLKKWKLTISKFKSSRFSYILVQTMSFVMDKSKSKMGASVSEEFALFLPVFFISEQPKRYKLWSSHKMCDALHDLLDNISYL